MSATFPRMATRVLDDAGGGGELPPPGEWRKGEALLTVKGDFGCVRDSLGRNQFSPFFFTLLDAKDPMAMEWVKNWRDPSRDYTHIAVSPKYGYPNSPIDGRDFGPARFAELCIETLDLGLIPMVMLTDYPEEMPKALLVVAELKRRGLLPYIWLCIAWEAVGPGGTYRSKEAYDANWALHRACGDEEHHIFAHLQPGRGSYSSNPVQQDDPWRIWIWNLQYDDQGNLVEYDESKCGDDAEVQKALHPDGEYATVERQCYWDMPFIELFCYQTEHEGWHQTPPLWEDRWRDIVPRFCNGMNGWRPMRTCLFETVLWNDYNKHFGPDGELVARSVASRGRDIAAEYDGATVSYGNGCPLPTVVRTRAMAPIHRRLSGQLMFNA